MTEAGNTPMKRYLLLFSAIGLVGCFLPLIGGASISLFDLRHFTVRAWLVVIAFLVPMVVAWRGSAAATVLAGLAGFVSWRLGPRSLDLVLYGGIGGKLIGIAIVGGVIATLGAFVESRKRATETTRV